MTEKLSRTFHIALRNQLTNIGGGHHNAVNLDILDAVIADAGLFALDSHAFCVALPLIAETVIASRDNPARIEATDEQLVDKIAPVHVLHFMVKVAENNLVHTAEFFDLLGAICICGQQRHLTAHDNRIRMHIKRENRTRAADLLGTLDRTLHERPMAQMHTVKVAERDGTRLCNFYHKGIPLKKLIIEN